MGRPLLDIDEKLVADLAFQGASNREIAAIVGCDDKTIANRFSALLTKRRAQRRLWIRSLQNQAAQEKQPTMLVWLGKNELDQTDRKIVTFEPPDDQAEDGDGNPIDP